MTHSPRSALESKLLTAALVLGACAFVPSAASAEEPTAASAPLTPARQLFADGRKLVGDGKYSEACPKFEESLRLEVGVGTQFNLADCWEHIGRTASAHALFLGAAASAKAAGQADREQVLRERATALEPRLSRLVIEVESTDPKLSVKRGDLPLDADSLGKAVPVDPGKYTIKARAPGKQAWEKVVEVTAATPVVTVQVPELEPLKAEKPIETDPAPTKPVAPPPSDAPAADHGASSINYRALSVAGIGVVALGVGTVMGIKFLGANGDAKDICTTNHNCSIKQIQDHDRLVDEARTDRRWAVAGFGVGGAALIGAGALWYFQRPKPKSTSSAAIQASPVVGLGTYGASVSGSF